MRGKLNLQMTRVFWVEENNWWVVLHKSWGVTIFKILELLIDICQNYKKKNSHYVLNVTEEIGNTYVMHAIVLFGNPCILIPFPLSRISMEGQM